MKFYIELDREEIQDKIPYALVCVTRFGRTWDTLRRKRRWKEEFTESERKSAGKLFDLARQWYLGKGVPDSVKMTPGTLSLWGKLGDFCSSL